MRRHHQKISMALIAILGLLFAIPNARAQFLVTSSADSKVLAYDPVTGANIAGTTFTGIPSASKVVFGADGYIYVVGNNTATPAASTIYRFLANGTKDTTYVAPAALPTKIGSIAFGLDGKLYVSDYTKGKVLRFLSTGALDTTLITLSTPVDGAAPTAGDLAVDSSGHIWVADVKNSIIYSVTTAGAIVTTIKLRTTTLGPAGIALDSSSRVLIALPTLNEVLRYSSTGTLDIYYIVKPVGTPAGISVDLSNNLYVVDAAGNQVLKATSASSTTSVFVAHGTALVPGLSTPLSATWATSVSSVTVAPGSVIGGNGNTLTGTVNLAYNAPFNLTVNLSSNNSALGVPQTATVLAGTNSITFPITTTGVSKSTTVTVTASLAGISQSTTVTVLPVYVQGLTFDKTTISNGGVATGTVTLAQAAGSNGVVVNLVNGNTTAATLSATTVTVPANATTATFKLTGNAVATTTTDTISATAYDQTPAKTATVTVSSVTASGLSLSALTVIGGATVTGTVTLSAAPTDGPATVALTTSNSTIAPVPTTATVAKGSTTGTFTINTTPDTAFTSITLTAAFGGVTQTSKLNVRPIYVSSIAISPTAVASGTNATGTVTLEQAPAQSVTVTLAVSITSNLRVPTSVTVAAGATSATFIVNTSSVLVDTTATISASSYDQSTPIGTSVTVKAVKLVGGTVGSNSGPIVAPTSIVMSAIVPSAVQVNVSSSNPHVTLATTPAGPFASSAVVTVPAGKAAVAYYAQFDGVSAQSNGNTTVTYNGTTLTGATSDYLNGPASISLSPNPVNGLTTNTITGAVNLYQKVSADTVVNLTVGAGVTLSTSTVTVPAGSKTSGSFTISTPVASTRTTASVTATIAAAGTPTAKGTVIINPPGVLISMTLSASSVKGGGTVTATLKLNSAGTAPVVATLSSNDPSATFVDSNNRPISTVTIPAGQTSVTVNVLTSPVLQSIGDGLSAKSGIYSAGAGLTVTP